MIVKMEKNSFQLHHQVQITCLQILWKANIRASTFKHSFNTRKKYEHCSQCNMCITRSKRLLNMEICVSPILMRNEDLLL